MNTPYSVTSNIAEIELRILPFEDKQSVNWAILVAHSLSLLSVWCNTVT